MKIAVDACGGDFGIPPNVAGSLEAARKLGCEIILVGDKEKIEAELSRLGARDKRISIVHAPTVADMGAEAVQECRDKPDCSIMVCARLVKKGEADGLVSAGNSGATMVASFLEMGRLPGISRPAIAAPLPTVKGPCLVLDAGANTECKPVNLLHFALMGSVYSEKILGAQNPSVGILSVGEEESKGNMLVKETIPLLRKSELNFIGPVEGRDIPSGSVDVVVCDGFVGNVVLKLAEGLSKAIFTMIKSEIAKRPLAGLGALLAKPAFNAIKDRTNPDLFGGAPLLGINGAAIISHGRSNSTAMFNSIKSAQAMAASGANDVIRDAVKKFAAMPEEAAT